MSLKNIFSKAIIIAAISIPASCHESHYESKIVGTWNGAEWLIGGMPSNRNAADAHFTFEENGNYTYEFAKLKEEGVYKVENEMLFTTPKGGQEMMVRITKLTKDSLVFDMSRSGQPETLVLLKK